MRAGDDVFWRGCVFVVVCCLRVSSLYFWCFWGLLCTEMNKKCANHALSREIARAMRTLLQAAIDKCPDSVKLQHLNTLSEACTLLIDCRQVLANACIFDYFMTKGANQDRYCVRPSDEFIHGLKLCFFSLCSSKALVTASRQLFEFLLDELESHTEKMQEMLEDMSKQPFTDQKAQVRDSFIKTSLP